MNARFFLLAAGALGFSVAAALAGSRASANYTVLTEVFATGGGGASSANYVHFGSGGGITGMSAVATPAQTMKHGFIGQFPDVIGLAATTASANVNEATSFRLGAWQALDDGTFSEAPSAGVVWSVVSGPLTGVSAIGIATAGAVFQDTSATAQAAHLGFTSTVGLLVVNTLADNFGSYAGDGLDDGWQNQFFGLDNPLAGPGFDPDGDGQTNHFEFAGGLLPTDSTSYFRLRIESVAGEPAHRALIFSPLVGGRTYTVLHTHSLSAPDWQTLTDFTQSDDGTMRTVTDTAPGSEPKFYRVLIGAP